MNRDDTDLSRLLTGLRPDEPDPSDGVSVERAIKDGRRTVYRHRTLGVLAVVVAILAVSFTPTLIGNQLNSDPDPVGPSPAVLPFDANRAAFTVGTAGGFAPAGYETGRLRQRLMLRVEDPDKALRGASGEVVLWAKGQQPYIDGAPWTPAEPAAGSIAGIGDYYVLKDVFRSVRLAWQVPDAGWGVVTLTGPEVHRDRAIHVIESVERQTGEEERVPFTGVEDPRSLPAGFDSVVGFVRSDTPAGVPQTALVRLSEGAGLTGQPDDRWLDIGVIPTGSAGAANTTIGGRQAVQTAHKVTVIGIGIGIGAGFDAVAESGPNGISQAELRRLVGELQLVDAPLNLSNWVYLPN